MNQKQIMYQEQRKIADRNEIMHELLYGPNPITDDELRRLITKNPSLYGAYEGFIGKREEM